MPQRPDAPPPPHPCRSPAGRVWACHPPPSALHDGDGAGPARHKPHSWGWGGGSSRGRHVHRGGAIHAPQPGLLCAPTQGPISQGCTPCLHHHCLQKRIPFVCAPQSEACEVAPWPEQRTATCNSLQACTTCTTCLHVARLRTGSTAQGPQEKRSAGCGKASAVKDSQRPAGRDERGCPDTGWHRPARQRPPPLPLGRERAVQYDVGHHAPPPPIHGRTAHALSWVLNTTHAYTCARYNNLQREEATGSRRLATYPTWM
jgi:hypothetical protein